MAFDPEKDKNWNREPGIVVIQGSNYANEMAKFEQFPNKYGPPGNPYTYRPFPKMVYRAELFKGKVACGAAPADPSEYANANEFFRMNEQAERFTQKCQLTVKDEQELQRAMENGFRESPAEAVAYLEAKMRSEARASAEREYADRNLSEGARAEAADAVKEAFNEGRHLPVVPEKRRRGRPRKDSAPAA